MSVDGVGNDLQIIYELRWKSDIGNRYNTDKVNIMGILDTADTCADWTSFKSYLMQNSGANEDTIIAYVDNDGEEIQINSENYQSTLEYCREKARKHEKVILVLKKPKSMKEHKHRSLHDRMKHHHEKIIGNGRRHHEFCTRRHVPNPFQFMTEYSDSEAEMMREGEDEQPPLWFIKYMSRFKADVGDLIMEAMLMMANGELEGKWQMAMANFNPPTEQVQVVNDKKKSKKKFCDEDSSDCVDGFTLGDRLLKKVHKLQAREKKIERKYEAKIGKLEHKVKRIIDKKTGLRSEKPHTSLGSTVVYKPKKHCSVSTQNSATSTTCPLLPRVAASAPCQPIIKVEKPKRCYSNRSTQNYENGTKTVSFKADKSTTCCDNYAVPDEVVAMNAIPLNRQMITEFAGRGEIISKRWEVMNNGLSPWTDETELRFTWGSSTLVPLTKVVKVPHLKPGETGIVEVTMQAPDALGRFESYWYFFHSGVRFGHWLGCAYVIGLQKDDRCRMPEGAVDLTITKCPRYYEVVAPSYKNNKCSGYHHISATTDDMKMSKSNSATPIDSKTSPEDSQTRFQLKSVESVDYVAGKPEKYVEEAAEETTLNLLMGDNESNAECLKPKSFEPKFNEFVESLKPESCEPTSNQIKLNEYLNNTADKINNKTVPESVEDDHDKDEEVESHLILDSAELNSDSDSDNISVISGTISVGSTDHGDDFVLIPMPELQKAESVKSSNVESDVSNENDLEHVEIDTATNSSATATGGILQEIGTNTEVTEVVEKPTSYVQSSICETKVDKPATYLQSSAETKVEKPVSYPDLNELNKIEKPSCYVSSTTTTNDSETNTENKITDSTNVCTSTECPCPLRKVVSELYHPRPFGFPHCSFGDPNCGSGPNGPRFPPSCYTHSSPVSHPTWRNGSSAFGNDFATCDQTKKPETATPFAPPYPGALRTSANSENYNYPYPGCIYPEYINHSHDSNTRRFVFNNSGTGFETYAQQVSANLTNETDTNIECEVRKPARYSYVYSEGRPIPATNIPKPDPPQRSTTNVEIPTTTSSTNGVHILPETIVNGAIQVAANAFNTACNVYDMIRGEGENNNNDQRTPSSHGTPIPSPTGQRRMSASSNDTSRSGSGQTNPRSLDNCLHILYEMGFYNRELNIKLLKRYNNDLPTVISKLV